MHSEQKSKNESQNNEQKGRNGAHSEEAGSMRHHHQKSAVGLSEEAKAEKERARGRERYAANREKLKSYHLARYYQNKEKAKAMFARYYAENKSKIKAAKDKYRSENKEILKARCAAHYAKNSKKAIEYQRSYIKLHPEHKRASDASRRARKLNAPIGSSFAVIKWDKTWRSMRRVSCFWCRNEFSPKKCHADHIVALSRGGAHEVGNLCISCQPCNNKKSAKTIQDWNRLLAEPVLL
jgi:5-methylcytosine-specific restriction endonuclease McrA